MKKIITILMAVCLMVSLLGISALAAPDVQTRPVLVDFDNETTGQYYNQYSVATPTTWFYLQGVVKIMEDSTNKYVRLADNANIPTAGGITFNAFEYDNTVAAGEAQPEKLVISVEAEYEKISGSSASISRSYNHFLIGKADDAKFVNNSTGSTANDNPFGDSNLALRYNLEIDTATSKVDGMNSATQAYGASEFDNMAFLSTLNAGGKIYYTFVLDHTRDAAGKGNFVIYANGAKSAQKTFMNANLDKIEGFSFSAYKDNFVRIDNVRVYTVANEKVAAIGQSVAATDVPYTTEDVTINFSHEIIDAADRYISVKKGDTALTAGVDYTLEHVADTTGAKTNKALKVKFANELAYGTTYSVVASADYFGIDGNALDEETTLASFTTEAAPQINLSAFTLKKGIFAGSTITDLSDALGSTVCVTTTATNTDARGAATGTVFFGVYKNDVLVSLAYVNKNFATAEADDISVNVKLPAATDSDTVAIKAFVCEGITNIAPYGTTIQVSTAD